MASPIGSIYVELGIDSAEFQRGLKKAEKSAKVFAREIDRSGREFRRLEASLDPAVAALRDYERAQKTAANAVRLGAATQDQANAVIAQARARYESVTNSFVRQSARAAGSSRGMGNAIQNAGFQVGDFAVQVASGGGVMRPFIQQGTQLVSMFGPLGAVVGAAGAVVGALGVAFLNTGEDARTMEERTSDLSGAIEGIRSAVVTGQDGLQALIKDYGELDKQLITLIQRQTKFNVLTARTQLRDSLGGLPEATEAVLPGTGGELLAALRSGQPLQEQRGEAQRTRLSREFGISTDQVTKIAEALAAQRNAGSDADRIAATRRLGDVLGPIATAPGADERLVALGKQVNDITLEIEEFEKTSKEARESLELLAKPIPELQRLADLPDKPGGGGGGSGRGGGRSTRGRTAAQADAFGALNERVQQLEQEATLIGLTKSETVRKTAAYEAERIALAALAKIREEGREPTEAEIENARRLAARVVDLQVANYGAAEAIRAQAAAADDAKRRQDELGRSIAQTADRFVNAIQQADSFADALKNIGLQLANMAIQGLGGQGPLGGILGGVIGGIGGIFGGGTSFSAGVTALAAPSIPTPSWVAGLSGFAGGGIADGWAVVGERGPELAHFGSPSRVLSNADSARALGGGMQVSQNFTFDMRGANVSESHMRRVAEDAAKRGITGLIESHREYPVFR